jgi:hypothetical protein
VLPDKLLLLSKSADLIGDGGLNDTPLFSSNPHFVFSSFIPPV